MRRVALAFIVATLTVSASGLCSLIVAEPCTGDEPPAQSDAACPPTCITCGCCAQAVEHATFVVAESPDVVVSDIDVALPGLLATDPRPILHVPKHSLHSSSRNDLG